MEVFPNFFNKIKKYNLLNYTEGISKRRYPNLEPLKKDTLTLSKKENYDLDNYNILSDSEYENLKKEIEFKISENSYLNKYFNKINLTKENILIAHKIITNKCFYKNNDFMEASKEVVNSVNTQEKSVAANNILNLILSDKCFYKNQDLIKSSADIICSSDTLEKSQSAVRVIDKLFSSKKTKNNSSFVKNASEMIYYADTKETLQARINIIDKILSKEKLLNNPDFTKWAREIIFNTKTAEIAEIKKDLIDKILSEGIYENPTVMKKSGVMLCLTNTVEQAKITNKILSEEKLRNNSDFMESIYDIIYYTKNPESADKKICIMDKILSDERLNNPNFMKYAGDMVSYSVLTENIQAKFKVIDKILSDERLANNNDFMKYSGLIIHSVNTKKEAQVRTAVIDNILSHDYITLTPKQMALIIIQNEDFSYENIEALNNVIGLDKASELTNKDTLYAIKFLPLYNTIDINEISPEEKHTVLRNLVNCNSNLFEISDDLKQLFPLLPKTNAEYCTLLPALVQSIGIKTNSLTNKQIEEFNTELFSLSDKLAALSDEEFNNLNIVQEYSKNEFISDTIEKLKNLSTNEKQQVYEYFGFELTENKRNETGYSLKGYPICFINENNLDENKTDRTKDVINDLRKNVAKFIENNPIHCNNKEIEQSLNRIISSLPEIRTMIGRIQAGMNGTQGLHEFDVMQHSLKVMQRIVQNPDFNNLNDSDKKVMLLASLLHDITKKEGFVDKTHEKEGGFDSFFISKKFNLSQEEEIKLNTIIKNHEWLSRVNTSKDETELTKRIQSTAYDLRHDNIFDMSLMFTHSDLKAVKKDDSFHNSKEGKSRIDFNGNIRSFGESADYYADMINECINELKKSQPILPITKLPKSSEIKSKITNINPDGSTNIKGLYQDKDGLIVIKYNEVEDWEEIGFPKGSISKGIKTTIDNKTIDTGNIKFIAHGLDYPDQLAKFDAFSLIDSDALLSVSYMERPESKYRLYKPQGVLLDVDTKYIHGGGKTDAGSGFSKDIQKFKDNYIFGAYNEDNRLFISNLIKKETGMNDEEYVNFVKNNENKSINEIEPIDLREELVKIFASIKSNIREGKREYNEMYISNPKKPIGVFAYDMNPNNSSKIGNPIKFLNSKKQDKYNTNNQESVFQRTKFLRQYALKNNIPFIVFGN